MTPHHYVRVCRGCGFENGPYWHRAEVPDDPKCAWCGGRVKVLSVAGGRPTHTSRPHSLSQKAFKPHYSDSFGVKVEDVHHYKSLMKKHNSEPADPKHWQQTIPRDWK